MVHGLLAVASLLNKNIHLNFLTATFKNMQHAEPNIAIYSRQVGKLHR